MIGAWLTLHKRKRGGLVACQYVSLDGGIARKRDIKEESELDAFSFSSIFSTRCSTSEQHITKCSSAPFLISQLAASFLYIAVEHSHTLGLFGVWNL